MITISKVAILAEKPLQGHAYGSAFSIKERLETHIELHPCSTFPGGAIITWGFGHLVEVNYPPLNVLTDRLKWGLLGK